MSSVIIDREIDLDEGKTVSVEINIVGLYEPRYGADADGRRGEGVWLIDSHTYIVDNESDEDLTEDERLELDKKIEELVYDGDWDFETASEKEFEPEDEI